MVYVRAHFIFFSHNGHFFIHDVSTACCWSLIEVMVSICCVVLLVAPWLLVTIKHNYKPHSWLLGFDLKYSIVTVRSYSLSSPVSYQSAAVVFHRRHTHYRNLNSNPIRCYMKTYKLYYFFL